MKLELLSLDIENFKSFRKFEFAPAARSMDIFGRNHAGKTPLADAYFWLLFGRDTEGKSDWHILPEDEHGQIVEGLVASVTGKFRKDGKDEFTLQRTYKQNFSHKKGEAERSVTSNTTNFFIGGVPKLKKDYTDYVSKLCDEKTFAMLTDPDQFPGKIPWKDRREFLIRSFAPDMNDLDIIKAHADLQPLLHYIDTSTTGDIVGNYAAKTKYERQRIQREKDEIPGRIDEAEKAKPADLPKDEDAHNTISLQRSKIQLEQQINSIRNGEAEADLRRQISEIQAQIADARAEYTRCSAAGNSGIEVQAAALRSQISEARRSLDSIENSEIPSYQSRIDRLNKEIADLRQRWINLDAQAFDPANNICPTCGQDYPPEKQEQIQSHFNLTKAQSLEKLEADATTKKDDLEKTKSGLEIKKDAAKDGKQVIADMQTHLDNLTARIVHPAPFEETEGYTSLRKKLESAQAQLKSISIASDDHVAELQKQLFGISEQLNAIRERALNKATVDRQNERIEELKKKESELSMLLATYDKGLALAEKFTMQKAQDIEESVNNAFSMVRWKLFERQVNGGINPCCEATVHGQGYNEGLGTSERLNAGLDIINTLSHRLGVSVPLWIDNAEGVTDYEPVDTQVFRLYVSAKDVKLRVCSATPGYFRPDTTGHSLEAETSVVDEKLRVEAME